MSSDLDFEGFVSEGGKFLWVATSDHPCTEPDGGCDARDGQVATLDDWSGDGLPRTGWSACGGNCRCLLVPMVQFALGIAPELDEEGSLSAVLDPAEAPAERDPRNPWKDEQPSEQDVLDWADEQVFVGRTKTLVLDVVDQLEAGDLDVAAAVRKLKRILAATGASVEED